MLKVHKGYKFSARASEEQKNQKSIKRSVAAVL